MLTKSQIEKFKTEGPNPSEVVALINTALELMTAKESPSLDIKRLLMSECTCVQIMQYDKTRHFRGCPLREKYPTHEAESNDKKLAAIYKAALVEIIDLLNQHVGNLAGDVDKAYNAAHEALSPTNFSEDDPRAAMPDFIPGASPPVNPEEAEEHHRKHMEHLLEKSGVPAVHYLAGAVKHLLADAFALGKMNDEHHGRLGRLERIVEGLEADLQALRLRYEGHAHPQWNMLSEPKRVDTWPEPSPIQKPSREAIRERFVPLEGSDRPKIVCLCGSTRFSKAFADVNLEETLKGNIVLTVGSMTHSDADVEVCVECGAPSSQKMTCTHPTRSHRSRPLTDPEHVETKKRLDALHKKKIELADEVFVLNVKACRFCKKPYAGIVDGCNIGITSPRDVDCKFEPYIGESTKSEIAHALALGKPIRFLNSQGPEGATTFHPGRPAPPYDVAAIMKRLGLTS